MASATVSLISFILCAIFYLHADFIISLYTKDIFVINTAVGIVLFLCLFHFFDAIQAILSGIFRGLYETKIVFYAPIFGYWFVGIPLGFTLGLTDIITTRMGLISFWYGLVFGLIINAITLSMILRVKFKKLVK
ncbi:hypothetical protein H8A87_01470 [Xenorhabdus sp. VLS]|uniref:Uncharacterized protein n=1 Tax=Xenorhabdus lircayensis TaxID=2763499 RepID=A0ABS0U0N9_9GAMM|nr:hypothetical protein [Xenorhabdus lircayensis]